MAPLAIFLTLGLAGLSSIASAHPGHDVRREAAERAAFMQSAPYESRSLGHCTSKLKARGTEDLNIARRQSAVHQLREARNLSTGMARRSSISTQLFNAQIRLIYAQELVISRLVIPTLCWPRITIRT